jgi:hypothetical protein
VIFVGSTSDAILRFQMTLANLPNCSCSGIMLILLFSLINICGYETQMGKHNQYAPPFPSGHRTPFTDLTNSSTVGNANQDPQKKFSQTAYAQITDEKESASPHRRHVNHQQKIPSAGDSVTHEPVAHTHASSIGAVQCTAFSDITNTPTDGTFIHFIYGCITGAITIVCL